MNTLSGVLFLFVLSAVTVHSGSEVVAELQDGLVQDLPRYVVFPGLDAGSDEIAEWNVGFASPFNVFFGPKPYVLGWVGEAGFGPGGEEGEEDWEEGEEGELEGEEAEEGEEGEEGEIEGEIEGEVDYDYEK